MRVQVQEQQREYDGFFKLDRAVLRFERFDGRLSAPVERLVFERGDSVAVLLYDCERDAVVLVEQFRYPVYLREKPRGSSLEIVAGTMEEGRGAEDVARSELIEEAGYALQELEHVATFYVSPGACTERIHLYLGHVSRSARVGPGGGVGAGEDIRVHELPLDKALRWLRQGKIRDAKTIIALQYLQEKKNSGLRTRKNSELRRRKNRELRTETVVHFLPQCSVLTSEFSILPSERAKH